MTVSALSYFGDIVASCEELKQLLEEVTRKE